MRKLEIALIALFIFAIGGVAGECVQRRQTERAQARTAESHTDTRRCLALASECRDGLKSAVETSKQCFNTLNMAGSVINTLTEAVWEYTPAELDALRKSPKPEPMPTTSVPQ